MAIVILLAFIVTPIVEIYVFLQVGGLIGVWPTIAGVLLTAAAGTWLLRLQGLRTLRRFQESIERNVFPVGEVFDGLCLLVAGALLLTPGFVTDAIGFLLFVPPLRRWLGRVVAEYLRRTGRFHVSATSTRWDFDPDRGGRRDDGTIEGEYQEIEPEAPRLRRRP